MIRALADRAQPSWARVAFSPLRNLLAATTDPKVVSLFDLDSGGESVLWRAPREGRSRVEVVPAALLPRAHLGPVLGLDDVDRVTLRALDDLRLEPEARAQAALQAQLHARIGLGEDVDRRALGAIAEAAGRGEELERPHGEAACGPAVRALGRAERAAFDLHAVTTTLAHTIFLEYLPFVLLLLALFTLAGGIYLEGNLRHSVLTNTVLIAIGTLLASVIGTTGAAMILIRPLIRANDNRRRNVHVVVFFIFLVANIGGALSPLGDPPRRANRRWRSSRRRIPFTSPPPAP